MAKRRKGIEIQVIDKSELVLLKNPTNMPDFPTYECLSGKEWIPLTSSARIPMPTKAMYGYEYNKEGQVRHNGELLKLYKDRRFIVGRTSDGKTNHMYMPNPEIIVGDGVRSFRFDSIAQAERMIDLDVSRLVYENVSINGWMAQEGWPQPFCIGGKSYRAEDYVGQHEADIEYLKEKGVYHG